MWNCCSVIHLPLKLFDVFLTEFPSTISHLHLVETDNCNKRAATEDFPSKINY